MSDVLQFDCSIDNEIARNATKKFAETLEKAFGQYKKLWNEYLKLRKHCEDANFKIPFQLFESDDCNNKDTSGKDINTSSQGCGCSVGSPNASQILPENIKPSTNAGASVPVTCSSGIVADLDDNVLYEYKSDKKQTGLEILGSPVLTKNYFRYKKNPNTSSLASNDSEKNAVQQCLLTKENFSILTDSPQKTELSIELEEDDSSLFSIIENNDEIQPTPMAKIPRKLGVSKLYNVDTTLLKNGKKVRQSKLVFLSPEKSTDNRLKSDGSSIPKKVCQDQNKSIDEEIIQVSPNKRTKSNLRIKNLKAKRKTPIKGTRNNNAEFLLKESGHLSLNQNSLSPCTSKQKNLLSPLKKFQMFSFSDDENMKESRDISSSLSPVDTVEHIRCMDNKNILTEIKNSQESESVRNINQPEEGSYSELTERKFPINSSCNDDDETFCLLGEKLKGKSRTIKENIIKEDRSPNSSPVRRCLMSSFDAPRKRKKMQIDPTSKKKSDRAKMAGVTCWECEKYYSNLGLSEDEIKARQNKCSRHRTNEKKRGDTPEGFWNPLFSGTYTSTLQDN